MCPISSNVVRIDLQAENRKVNIMPGQAAKEHV